MVDLERVALPLLLEQTLRAMHRNGTLNVDEILSTVHAIQSQKTIPLSTFSLGLYPLESISFYLHDVSGISFAEIGRVLGRNERSVWASYQRAVAKRRNIGSTELKTQKLRDNAYEVDRKEFEKMHIPLSIFTTTDGIETSSSLQYCLCVYLKNTYHWNNKQIAHALLTSQNSIATVLKRGAA